MYDKADDFHRPGWDMSDAELAYYRHEPEDDGPSDPEADQALYASSTDCTLRSLEDSLNDLAAEYLDPQIAPERKLQIKQHAQTLRGFCALLER